MKPEQYNVEDLFRSAFEDASLEPPHNEDMWAAIQSAVQTQPAPVISIFRTNRFKVGIAASLVLLLGTFYYFGNIGSPINSEKANELTKEETKENTQSSGKQENILTDKSKEKESSVNTETQNAVSNTNSANSATSEVTTDNAALSIREERKLHNNSKENNKAKVNVLPNPTTDGEVKNQEEKVAVIATTPNKVEKEDAFSLVRYEIREIIALASPEIVVPFSIEKQPILQLVAVIQPQIEGEKTKPENTFWVGFSGFYNAYQPSLQFSSPDLPSPFIKGKLSSINFADSSTVARDMRESMTINSAISLNIDFGKKIGKHWFVRSGLNFSSTSYAVNSPVVELLSSPDPTNPILLGGTKVNANTINSSTTAINIPIQFGYQSDRVGFNYFVSGGITTDILLNNSLTNTYAPAVYDFGNYKTVNLSMIGSGGLLYNFTSQFGALVEFNYRRSLSSVYDSPNFSSNPQWIGVGVGIRKKF